MNINHIYLAGVLFLLAFVSCTTHDDSISTVGFVDAFEDATISQARDGFVDALKDNGYSEEDNTIRIIYKNAQGDIPTLTQIVNYFVSEKVDLIASNTTLSTITAIQRAKDIPIFMMVSPEPEKMAVINNLGEVPTNLFGVFETLAYIDTSVSLIPKFIKPKGNQIVIGMVYNQAEPQSQDALKQVETIAKKLSMRVKAMPINSSADAQLVTQSLLNQGIDVFFANPDNTVFASFETILKNCNQKGVPVFTSEAGLVKRGAVAAYGADIYQWGYQAGEQAVQFLESGNTDGLTVEQVKLRKRVYNPDVAEHYNLELTDNFERIE